MGSGEMVSGAYIMPTQVRIIGIHPIEADEPVHLIELLVEGDVEDFDIGELTQEMAGQPKMNWQAPYDDRLLEASEEKARYAFFFHYLDPKRPLLTSHGSLPLPKPTTVPEHLRDIEYEPP
jgi:hypothetical protein